MKLATLFTALLAPFTLASIASAQPAAPTISPASHDAQIPAAVDGINRFSLDLYRASIKPDENLFLSPASVSTAIGLAYRGAVGPTADELRATLHYPTEPRIYGAANGALLRSLELSKDGRELRIANALWVQERMPLNPDYLTDVTKHYAAGLHRVDYDKDPKAARLTINEWVGDATRSRIKNLLSKDDVTKDTSLVLVNAIYWKGGWATPFKPAGSKVEPFTRLDGRKVQTTLMNLRARFKVAEQDGVKAIALPYDGNEVSMIVLMPGKSVSLPAFEAGMTGKSLSSWFSKLGSMADRDTILTLPRMHLEWRNDLVTPLNGLGIKLAFTDFADFSGIAQLPHSGGNPKAIGLKIGHVIHKTYLDVDEEGSEAAAATAVVMSDITVSGTLGTPPPPFIFRADKPFLFLLRDNRTGTILFIGRYVAPPEG